MLALAVPLALAVLFAACGGDDDDGDDGGSDSGSSVQTGSDEKYVADMCKAFNNYAEGLTKALASFAKADSEADIEKMLKSIIDPTEDFAKAFSKMKPPADLKDWHAATAKALSAQVKSLKDAEGLDSLDALADVGDIPMGEMPPNIEERLTKIADGNKDCQAANLFGE